MEQAYKLEFENEKNAALRVNCCGCSRTEALHSFGPAMKPHYMFHYVLSGRGMFRMGGKEYRLEAGYGFFIAPQELVFYQADEKEPWSYVWVGFSGSKAEEYLEAMGLNVRHPIFRSEKSDELYQIIRDMMEHNTWGMVHELRRDGLLQIFLSVIAESNAVTEKKEEEKANQYVRRAVEFIQRNYSNPIRVTDVAEYVCVNRSYLYTLFQTSIGMSPQQFLASYRLTRAAELLLLPGLSIESIALSCGYQDPLVFTKAFRHMKGVSPSAYRREMQKRDGRKDKEYLKQIEDFIERIRSLEQNGEGGSSMQRETGKNLDAGEKSEHFDR